MTAEEFGELCRECCTKKSIAECVFADGEVGFIDTSVDGDGSRGIAFSKRKMMVNFDGTVKNVAYCKIRSVQIISSQEDAFADELEIFGGHSRLRISDCSLDKSKLKRIIEALQEGLEENIEEAPFEETPGEEADEQEIREETPAEEVAEQETREEIPSEKEIPAEEVVEEEKHEEAPAEKETPTEEVAEEEKHEEIPEEETREEAPVAPEEKAAEEKPSVFEEKIVWLSDIKGAPAAEKEAEFETADSGFIEQMSREEMLDFLNGAMKEINYDEPASQEERPEIVVKQPEFVVQTNAPEEARAENKREAVLGEALAVEEKKTPKVELSKEPAWGDIYIKASRSLRELCESGRLSMERIEEELREKLLDSARAFAEIISDEQKVPKVLLPKITELKNASNNFDEYFSYGEDIGIRVMFFMLYQMLSYADRIAENPDTKERLNDFFRRFGVAGITLSMLDVRA